MNPSPDATRPRRSARRRRTRSGYVVVLGLLAAITGATAFLSPHGRAAASADPSLAVREGRQLYLQGCSTCHGLQAQGTSFAPSLIGVGSAAVDFQVSSGRMPLARQGVQAERKKPRFSQQETDRLAAYVQSLSPGPQAPGKTTLDTSQANLQEGRELFAVNCASCHNFAGKGGALTGGRLAPSLVKATDRQIYEAMLTGPESMPVFGDSQLTPDQKRDIIKFVRAAQAQPDPGGAGLGRLGAVPEGLVSWLIGIVVLVLVTLWIGARA